MRKTGIFPVGAACLAALLACDGAPFLATLPAATPTIPSTETATLNSTPTPAALPSVTRTASPTLIPGIQDPVEVGDAQLLILKALRRDDFRCGGDIETVEDPESQEFLLLVMKVIKGPSLTTAQVKEWIRDNGVHQIILIATTPDGHMQTRKYDYLCYERNPDSYVLTQLILAFLVDLNADVFFVSLPDGTEIPLSAIMP